MENLSKREQKVFVFLKKYLDTNGYPPTVREIGKGIGVKSTSLISYYLKALEKRGLITRETSVSRAIRLTSDAESELDFSLGDENTISIPFLGYVVASAPIPVEALSGTETVEINRALFGREAEDLFALRVQGDSMIDALVGDGDMIILRHQERVENGEMAVVWLTGDSGETTLKKVYYEAGHVRLQPANPLMEPIIVPAKDVQVQGKVVMVIRNLE